MSLILCPECNHRLSDKAISCPGCGYPMLLIASGISPSDPLPDTAYRSLMSPAPRIQTRKRSHKKLPNGYGTIKKLSGTRTRPYAAYPPASAAPFPGEPG